MSWMAIAGVTAAITAGAILQGAVGFGIGLLSIPFLVHLDLRFVPGPLLVASLTLHLLLLRRERSEVDASGLAVLLGGRLLGIVPAAALLAWLPIDATKLLLGAVVLASALMSAGRPSRHPTRATLFGAGFASGFMATTAGIGGPPVALVYQHVEGRRLRGTLAAFFVVGTVLSLLALAAVGRFTSVEMRLSLLLIPGTVLGYFLSRPAAAFLDSGHTRTAVVVVSALAAVSLIVTALL